jgi:hypothetical protein
MCLGVSYRTHRGQDSLLQKYFSRFSGGSSKYTAVPDDDCDVPKSYSASAAVVQDTVQPSHANGCVRKRNDSNFMPAAREDLGNVEAASGGNARFNRSDAVSHDQSDQCMAELEPARNNVPQFRHEQACSAAEDDFHRDAAAAAAASDTVAGASRSLSCSYGRRRHRSSSSASEMMASSEDPGGSVGTHFQYLCISRLSE